MATLAGQNLEAPILIAGGGPVGLVTAIELGSRNVECILLNDQPVTAQHPKANAISARSMEHFRRLGVAESIRQCGLEEDHPTDVVYLTRLTGYEIGRFKQPSRKEALRQALAGEGPWDTLEPPHRCSQIFLEDRLKKHAENFPSINLKFGWRLESFVDYGSYVESVAQEVSTGQQITIQSQYLIGCDGPSSLVRKGLEIDYEGESGVVRDMMGGQMVASHFKAKIDSSWLPCGRAWQYWIVNPEIRALLMHINSQDEFVVHFALPPKHELDHIDPRKLLHQIAGKSFPLDVLSTVKWTAGFALVAQKFKKGRVLIAGDAAHLFTPTGGLGMNTGIEDAVNLGWKLASVLKGWAHSNILETYEQERRPIGLRNVKFASRFAHSVGTVPVSHDIEQDSEAGDLERQKLKEQLEKHAFFEFQIPGINFGVHYAHSEIIAYDGTNPPPEEVNSYTPHTTPGSRLPHIRIGEQSLLDLLGPDYTLLCLGEKLSNPVPMQDATSRWSLPLKVVRISDSIVHDFLRYDWILVRPDQHIAWRGNQLPSSCEKLVDKIRKTSSSTQTGLPP